MKPSLEKLQKFFNLEAERGYDNNAVMGGLDRMLEHWETEARTDELSEDIINAVTSRIRDYSRLSSASRAEVLDGIWKRVTESEVESPQAPENSSEVTIAIEEETSPPEVEDPSLPPTQPAISQEITPKISPAAGEPAALDAPVTVLRGIGKNNAKTLERLELRTLRDLLYYLPRRYDDYSLLKPINRLEYGEVVTVIGTIQSVNLRKLSGGKRTLVEAVISDGSGSIKLSWFNQPWRVKTLRPEIQVVASGKIDQYLGRLVMNQPELELMDRTQLHTNRIVPVYPLTSDVKQRWLRRQINQVVVHYAPKIVDPLPEEIRQSADLIDLDRALLQIHAPDSWDDLRAARDRLAFDEIFHLQLGLMRQKITWQERTARQFTADEEWFKGQFSRLPFQLTHAQVQALSDIVADLASGHPMNRLIQGDVGSGKTVIAGLAIAMVTKYGAQSVIMAPTSILAEQHYKTLLHSLAGVPNSHRTYGPPSLRADQIRLMLGATPESEKNEIRAGLDSGNIKLVIGTHALIEDPVSFADLQLIIIDEQHRFGVNQRALLRAKGENPHLIVMTATPIPRSLALTVYGDLDITVIDEMPPGRKQVTTQIIQPTWRERAYLLVQKQVEQGHQGFIIYPLVEESPSIDAKAAVEEHARLQSEIFPDLRLGLLHGRLPPDEKEAVMSAFRDGEYDLLVSTLVVEVGVDIPNATVMIIEGANRFGLAQLHQLRGRVGRGADQAYCILIPSIPDELENERLLVMSETDDGFLLAERDLEQRGPGEFLGTRQSGYTELKVANITNVRLIEKARRQARKLFEVNPDLRGEDYQLLADFLQQSWSTGQSDIS